MLIVGGETAATEDPSVPLTKEGEEEGSGLRRWFLVPGGSV